MAIISVGLDVKLLFVLVFDLICLVVVLFLSYRFAIALVCCCCCMLCSVRCFVSLIFCYWFPMFEMLQVVAFVVC